MENQYKRINRKRGSENDHEYRDTRSNISCDGYDNELSDRAVPDDHHVRRDSSSNLAFKNSSHQQF